MTDQATGPLHGVKVADFSNFIAGCFAAATLGDLGADVTKVEAKEGDGARFWGPFIKGESRFFQGWNRNKRGIAVDMRSEPGREIVHKLIAESDILVENFRPGVTKRLGIDYETARAINPRLIYLSITAFGTKGPLGDRPGYDPILQSLTGAVRANERYSGKAAIGSVAFADFGAALVGTNGILAALYHRERTGEGQRIETTLLQAAMTLQSHSFCDPLEAEEEPPFGIYPYKLFETKDDLLFIAGPTDKFWRILCEALGVPELGTDPRYDTNPGRVDHGEELTEQLEPILRTKTTDEWERILVEAGVPCGPVLDYMEFFRTPQVEALGMNPRVEHSTIGPMRVAGVAVNFEKTPGTIRRAAPTLGQHTDEILAELGFDATRISDLRAAGDVS